MDPFNRVPQSERQAKVLQDVKSHRWHVYFTPEDEHGECRGFTIGLHHTFGHPEVIVTGLPFEMTVHLLNTIGRYVSEGRTFVLGNRYEHVFKDSSCVFFNVVSRFHTPYADYARWFYSGDEFPLVQCVWPDDEGNFPWEDGFTRSSWGSQLLLMTQDDVDLARELQL